MLLESGGNGISSMCVFLYARDTSKWGSYVKTVWRWWLRKIMMTLCIIIQDNT